jgi:hypothetical protein
MPILRARISLRSGLISCLLLACFFLADFGAAASFTLDQVIGSPFPTNLVAASHSPRVAWVFNAKGVRNLWVADAPDFAARQITHYDSDDGLPIASLHGGWAHPGTCAADQRGGRGRPHQRYLARKRQVWPSTWTPRSRLWVTWAARKGTAKMSSSHLTDNLQPGRRATVGCAGFRATPAHQLTDLRGDNSNPKWSPDGRQIAGQQSGRSQLRRRLLTRPGAIRHSADAIVCRAGVPIARHCFVRQPGIQGKFR